MTSAQPRGQETSLPDRSTMKKSTGKGVTPPSKAKSAHKTGTIAQKIQKLREDMEKDMEENRRTANRRYNEMLRSMEIKPGTEMPWNEADPMKAIEKSHKMRLAMAKRLNWDVSVGKRTCARTATAAKAPRR
jgi:hypothetical protein